MNTLFSHSRQRGLTMVEILVALAISLFLLTGIIQIFLSTQQTYRVEDNLSRLQENGRFAMDFLGRNIREAGYIAISVDPNNKRTEFSGIAVGNTTYTTTCGSTSRAICGADGGTTGRDWLAVSFDADTDCLGSAVASGVAFNWFSVNSSNNLACLGNGNANPEPLIEGVEDMQVWYGVDNNNDQTANSYVPASGAVNWNNIVSARVCLLLRSNEDNLIDKSQAYQNCNGVTVTAPDRRLRRAFTATFNLRNRVTTSPAL